MDETMNKTIAPENLISIEEAVQLFDKVAKPPQEAMKYIDAGRLKGKSEINPLWRMRAMTENYGHYGDGWKIELIEKWTEEVEATKEKIAHCLLFLYTRNRKTGEWNSPSPSIGSSYLIVKDKNGLHGNENAWASAITDAFGKACKPLGIGYEVYMGKANSRQYYNNYNNNNYNNNYQNNYQKNNNYQKPYNNNYNNYNKPQYQQSNTQPQYQAPAQNQQGYANTQNAAITAQPQQTPKPANANALAPSMPPQDATPEEQKKFYMASIKRQMEQYNITSEEMKNIVKDNFMGKESSADMTVDEIMVLDKNLRYMANLEKQKKEKQ